MKEENNDRFNSEGNNVDYAWHDGRGEYGSTRRISTIWRSRKLASMVAAAESWMRVCSTFFFRMGHFGWATGSFVFSHIR